MNSNIYREIFKFALMYLHRNKLEKGTYVNFQIFGKFMKVSRKFLNVTQHGENFYLKKLFFISLFTELDGDACNLMLVYAALEIMARH